MTLFVEYGKAGEGGVDGVNMPVEIGSLLFWSESLASGAVTTGAASEGTGSVFTLTASADGYLAFGKNPDASVAGLRRRLLASQRTSFAARKGDKVSWVEG